MLTKEKIMKFCDSDGDQRINRPWSVGDKTYSTNGHLIIRIDRQPEIEEKADAPDIQKLFEKDTLSPQEWFEIPELPKPKYKDYSDCIEDGKIEILEKTEINGSIFQNQYLRLLKELSNCKISPTGHDKPAWFKFDGGDGLIMPMRY